MRKRDGVVGEGSIYTQKEEKERKELRKITRTPTTIKPRLSVWQTAKRKKNFASSVYVVKPSNFHHSRNVMCGE